MSADDGKLAIDEEELVAVMWEAAHQPPFLPITWTQQVKSGYPTTTEAWRKAAAATRAWIEARMTS